MKIEEYLNSLEKKELIYIFLSIPIVIFIIYYNFVYPDLEKQKQKLIKTKTQKINTLKTVISEIRKVKNSKNILIPIREKLENLKEDYKYIYYTYHSLELVQLNDKKIYTILTQLLNKSNILNLNTSFDIKWDIKPTKPYNNTIEIKIKGDGNYQNIIKYLQFIDHLKSLTIINNAKVALSLKDSKSIKPIIETAKQNNNSISFVLTKYSDNTIKYLKNIAKSKNLSIFISVNKKNINYLNISFKGEYLKIKSVLDLLKNMSRQKNKQFEFIKLKASLKYTKQKTKNTQQFLITLKIVGVK